MGRQFGFDRIERQEHPDSANLLYKVRDARNQEKSTALATNVDSNAWADYLGDPRWRWHSWTAWSIARSS